jgi:hypothetical protein
MTNIIKYNDFVQINPDKRILSLDKKEKVQITDNIINRAYSGGKGLVITYDLSHSGRRINNRIYSTKGQQKGIDSLTEPYAKPILLNHDQSSEPIGRFIGGEWQNLYDEASDFLQSSQAIMDIHNVFAEDDPGKIYNTLKSFDLINNKKWPGLGRMRVQANITDEEAIKKFMDGRYLTFSAGSTTNRHVCSICESDWSQDGMCEHRHGQQYDGETCVFITGDFIVLEGSVVNTPADDLSQIVHMEMRDSNESSEITDYIKSPEEIIMTDSTYELGDKNETRIQETEQVDAYKEETKEEGSKEEKVEKKYDHEMSISESAMMELHEKGETYITQRGDGETMIIKVKYSGSMKKDSLDFELMESEIAFLIEELNDEKTFKVPAGAKGNAQKVLDWKSKHGSEVKGMTPVGWARARQLASKSEIGLSTVKRMAAFNRHRKNAAVAPEYKDTPWKDRGYVAWLGWGGTSGIDWAIKISAANDSEATSEDAYRSSPKGKGAKTPAKPSERIKGSKKNKEGSASKANSKISVGAVLDNLKEKVRKHNEKYGKEKGKRVSLGMLKAVYRRGAGAFSSTHRPGMSRSGWGVARVNAFLKLVRSGRPSNPKYVQDNDLLPGGHPRKSSNKSKTKKDFAMSEEITTEEVVVEEVVSVDSEEISPEDTDLLEEVVEPTEEEQAAHDESFDSEEVKLEDEEIDWEILDLALQATMADAQLSTEQRKELPDSAFCGPDRSFPVPDCAHVTAARRLVGRAKVSGSVKQKIMGCVNSKAAKMKCDQSEDMSELENQLKDLQAKYDALEEKFKMVLENIAKTEDSEANISNDTENEENNASEVETVVEDSLNSNEEVSLTDVSVESPSVHTEDKEEKMTDKLKSLGSFEKKIVVEYRQILADQGELAAAHYFASKASYLPRGFNPNNF